MFAYNKRLQYPIDIKKKDLETAKIVLTQYGGAQGELGAALRYLNQRYTMPNDKGKALLTDIGTEELGHVEMICTMVYALTKGATVEELKRAGLDTSYAEHGMGLSISNSSGIPWSAMYISTTGDPLADLSEDMAAEQKARAVYENMMNVIDNEEVLRILEWLRQREIVHYTRFKELFEEYKNKLNK